VHVKFEARGRQRPNRWSSSWPVRPALPCSSPRAWIRP